MGRGLVGDDVDGRVARAAAAGRPRRRCRAARWTAAGRLSRPRWPADGVVDVVGLVVEVAVLDAAGDPGLVAVHADRHAAVHGDGQRLGAAHAAQAGGQRDRARPACRRTAWPRRRRTSRRCPAGCPGCRCRSRSPRSSGRTWSARAASRRRNSSQVAHCGTRLELAMSTRGAHSWVRNTPTGLPDWTSRVSSSSRSCSVAMIAVEGVPAAGGAAGAAVDDELVGVFGHLGVEVVHQHAHRALGGPALAAALGAAGRADRVPCSAS